MLLARSTRITQAGRTEVSGPLCVRRRASERPTTGFSLLELTLVLAIVAIVAAIAAPRYARAISRYRVEVAAQRVKADFEAVRTRARASSTTWTLQFDLSADTYAWFDGTDPAGSGEITTVDLARSPYKVHLIGTSFSPVPAAAFDGFGVPAEAGMVALGAGGFYKSITIEAETGRVIVSELLGSPPPIQPPSS